jgi:ABC-2 type transport system permease protein
VPAFLLPDWARDFARLVPTTWAMRGFDAATWQARGLWPAAGSAAAVTAFAVVLFALAGWRFRAAEARRRRGDG